MRIDTSPVTPSDLPTGLRRAVRGRVLLPGDSGFDDARRPWNLAVDQPAAAVVEAADAADVAALVRYASTTGMAISTQPSGHGASGRTEGSILLRTGRLDGVRVDAPGRRAMVGAGVRSGALQAAVAAYGLTGLPGSSPVVSVAGVVLGGGLSWFGRARGWVADSVIAFDIVDADGNPQHVTAVTDPDMFWALRGGGGDYAVVTALELALHEAPQLYGGRVLWDGAHAAAVLDVYRDLTRTAPDEMTVWFDRLHFPGGPPLVAIDATYLGDERAARGLLAALDRVLPPPLSDTRRPMSVAELGGITAEPTEPAPGQSRCELLTTLDDDTVGALVAEPIAPLMSVQIRHLGGALARPSDSPHGPLTEPYAVYMFGAPSDPVAATTITAKQQALATALPTSGRKPVTFLNPSESLADALPAEAIDRLRRIKAERDPAGLFRSNFSTRS